MRPSKEAERSNFQECDITGKRPLRARAISHATTTNRFQKPTCRTSGSTFPAQRWVRLKVSTCARLSINRVGLLSYCEPKARPWPTSRKPGAWRADLQPAAGYYLDTSRERISVRRILAYAAGSAPPAPAFDDDREGGVVAMPPFCVSLEWPVVSGARARDGLGAEGGALPRLHASQDSFFHRPIRPGDELETRRIASVERRAPARWCR